HYEVQITYYPSQKAYYLFFSDIRERREAQAQLLLSESVFSNSLDGILITDPDAVIQRVNAAYIDISGYSEDELIGRTPGVMRSDRQDRRFYNSMWESLKRNGYWSGEIWDRRKNGDEIPLLLTINSISSEEGRLAYYVGVFKDISDLKKSEEKLRHQAYYDGLTGLPNRSLFLDRLTQAIAFADRTGTQIAVMFLDLDNFKNINDSMGHNVGDLYLKKISERLRQGCRDEDTIARLGGDEFLVMMPGIDSRKSTEYVVRRFQKALHKPISIEGLEVHTTASMGIACYPSDGTDPLQLMQNADMAMYQSKKRGKDCYTHFEEEMNKNVLLKVELDGRMRKALVLDEFEVVYQPKVEVSDGTVRGAEALIRWNSADGRVISPTDFIPLAEENGFILKLGDWILERVLLDLRDMKEVAAGDFQVAVNLSGRQFRDRDLLKRISRIIDSSDQPYESINFEITESVAMEDSQATLEILESLHKLNVGISIDDFGTGYSSLSYLKRFKTHILKIDKSFVDELPEDRKGSALVQDIIHMAHNLDMKIVAEGVEEKKQLDFLKDAGCDTIQGYYFSRPLGKKDFLNYLENHSGGILKHSGS
ncbi:MAG: EAL domain-containing protein, partial [Spirochaetales bacterium]|nr:EAL domain-containing protein [Spirochaetales bacterium]